MLLLVFCRAFLWLTFAFSFIGKIRHPATFVLVIHRFRLLPNILAKPTALFFLATEATLLLLLGTGLWLQIGFVLAFLLLLTFTIALVVALLRQQQTACHCFGADEHPIGWTDVVRNGGLLLVAGWGWLTPPPPNAAWLPTLLFALMGMVYGLLWLHLSDIMRLFRHTRQTTQSGLLP